MAARTLRLIKPSRIGMVPVNLPETVSMEQKGNWIRLTGPRGSLFKHFDSSVKIEKVCTHTTYL
jgi:ribosomal protein L6P/L9E